MADQRGINRIVALTLLALTLALAGCGPKVKPGAGPGSTSGENRSLEGAGANTAGAAEGAGSQEEIGGPQGGLLATRIVYFDFDSAVIKGEGVDVVAAHAKYLASHPEGRVRLEGNTDERGSREYNIGLGDRRAQAVRRALLLQGAADAQISTVSYGEERPAAAGHDETAWAKNRRVEIVYLGTAPAAPATKP